MTKEQLTAIVQKEIAKSNKYEIAPLQRIMMKLIENDKQN